MLVASATRHMLISRTQAEFGVHFDDDELPPKEDWSVQQRYVYESTVRCALQLEQRYAGGFARVVWFVSSDAVPLKRTIAAEFGTGHRNVLFANTSGRHSRFGARRVAPPTKPGDEASHQAMTWMAPDKLSAVLREQLPTPDQSTRDEYARDVADAFADWWLLGQADLAVLAPTSPDLPLIQNSYARTALARGLRAHSVYALPRDCATGEHSEMWPR